MDDTQHPSAAAMENKVWVINSESHSNQTRIYLQQASCNNTSDKLSRLQQLLFVLPL